MSQGVTATCTVVHIDNPGKGVSSDDWVSCTDFSEVARGPPFLAESKFQSQSLGANSGVGIILPTVSVLPPSPPTQELSLLNRLLGKVNWGEETKCKPRVFQLGPSVGKEG